LVLASIVIFAAAGATAAYAQAGGSSACACGEVTAFTAPATGAPGTITIGGQTFPIAETTTIQNAELIVVGSDLCLSGALDASGALIAPAAVAANDGSGASTPPLLSVPTSVSVSQGGTFNLDVTGTDPQGGLVSVTACGVPENATFDESTGQLSFTPAAGQANQSFPVTFTATSCFGGVTTRTVTLNVGAAGSSTQGGPFFSTASTSFQTTPGTASTFNITAGSPVSGCDVTVTATGLPTGAAFDAATGAVTFTPTEDQLGRSFTAVFTATDCDNRTATFALPISVTAADGSTAGAICSPVKKIQFNSTPIGSSCGSVTVTIANSGGQALTVSSASLATGTDFFITGTSPNGSTLSAGGELQFTITFVPTARGNRTDTLTIQSDDANQPSLTIKLSGKGTQ
jgi:hypothetical protein